MPVLPNDIGLAKYDDVGNVANLNTQSKIIVNAINEVLSGASSDVLEQLYVVGDDNKINGTGNVIYGSNNIIIGNNNIVVGDNLIVLGDNKQINAKPDFYTYQVDPYTKTVYYDDVYYPDEIVVGDNIALAVDIGCMHYDDQGNYDWISLIMPKFITTVTSIGSGFFIYGDSPLPPDIPEGYYLDMTYASAFSILKDSWKVSGNGAIILGSSSSGLRSFSANLGNSKGNYSFAANSSYSEGYSSFSANYGKSSGDHSLATNSGEAYERYSAALNDAFAYGGNSLAVNYGRTAGRPIKCSTLNCFEQSITALAGEDVSNLVGKYIVARYKNNSNTIIHNYTKVTNVIGQKIYVENSLGGGTWGEALMTDGYIFRSEEYYSYNLATGYGMAGNRYSQAHGLYTLAVHDGSVIYGKYGVTPETHSWALANGTSFSDMGLAAKILSNGNMFIDGTYSSPCADYAEFFEWADTNILNEDRVGYFVKLVDGKIEKATDFEDVLGITSGNPAILGDSGELHWNGKFLTDDFGRIKYHEVLVPEVKDDKGNVLEESRIETEPILNPDYNPEQEYIPRKNRPEWSAVGVMGKLPVRDDGSSNIGDFVRPTEGGIATKSINTGYKVIKRISENVILVWMR